MTALLVQDTPEAESIANTPDLTGVSSAPHEAESAGTGAASPVGAPTFLLPALDIVSQGYEDFTHAGETVGLRHEIWTNGVTYLTLVLPETTAHVRIDCLGMSIDIMSRTTNELYCNITAGHCECLGFQYRHRCEHQRIADRAEAIAHAWLDRRERDAQRRDYDEAMDMKHWEEVAA